MASVLKLPVEETVMSISDTVPGLQPSAMNTQAPEPTEISLSSSDTGLRINHPVETAVKPHFGNNIREPEPRRVRGQSLRRFSAEGNRSVRRSNCVRVPTNVEITAAVGIVLSREYAPIPNCVHHGEKDLKKGT